MSPLALWFKESLITKRKRSSRSRAVAATPGSVARSISCTLRSYSLGALPILDDLLKRMKLEEFLRDYLPKELRSTAITAARGLTVLVKNFLLAREPIYGLGEWAAACAPDALGLSPEQVLLLNDDRAGRWMTEKFSNRPGGSRQHLANLRRRPLVMTTGLANGSSAGRVCISIALLPERSVP